MFTSSLLKSIVRNGVIATSLLAATAVPAFAQSDWQRSVARIIASHQTYPHMAQMRGEEGTAKVKVYITASGTVEKTELVGPSGSSTLDKEAVALPAKAGTFPAPPGGATTVILPLTWKLI